MGGAIWEINAKKDSGLRNLKVTRAKAYPAGTATAM